MSKPFVIFTDASNFGVGAVLVQDGRPVWFASRSLDFYSKRKPLGYVLDCRNLNHISIQTRLLCSTIMVILDG